MSLLAGQSSALSSGLAGKRVWVPRRLAGPVVPRRSIELRCSNSSDENGTGHSVLSSVPSDHNAVLKAQWLRRSYGSAPPPSKKAQPIWTDSVLPPPLPNKLKIFCNRALNMRQIQAVGFDMDYTLAQYRPETFEALAHKETIGKLVNYFGYPDILYSLNFSCAYMMKGLIIDKNRGSMLKVDRHRYVKVAYHGFNPLSHDDRKSVYNKNSQQDLTFDEPDYAMVDTLFSLAEAYLFMQLVELKDDKVAPIFKTNLTQTCTDDKVAPIFKTKSYADLYRELHAAVDMCHHCLSSHPPPLPTPPSPQDDKVAPIFESKSYADLYRELRAAVDMCHRDGSLKKAVAASPEKFIHKDPLLVDMLVMLRKSGRRVFLATNSLWDFTNVVMNYLISDQRGADKTHDWLDYFDVVMVGCGKPKFFNNRGQLFSVDIATGYLQNTDNGAPTVAIDDQAYAGVSLPIHSSSGSSSDGSGSDEDSYSQLLDRSIKGKDKQMVFQGGCYNGFSSDGSDGDEDGYSQLLDRSIKGKYKQMVFQGGCYK
eukprot:gene13214-19050_t